MPSGASIASRLAKIIAVRTGRARNFTAPSRIRSRRNQTITADAETDVPRRLRDLLGGDSFGHGRGVSTRSSLCRRQGPQNSFLAIFSRRRSSRDRRVMAPIRSCVSSSIWEECESGGSGPSRREESFPLPLEVMDEPLLDLLMVPSDLDAARCSQRLPTAGSARPSVRRDAYNPRTTAMGGPPGSLASCGLSSSFMQTCRSLST